MNYTILMDPYGVSEMINMVSCASLYAQLPITKTQYNNKWFPLGNRLYWQ